MHLFIPTLLALLAAFPTAFTSLQSPAFKIYCSYSSPNSADLNGHYLTSYHYHPGPFYWAILASPSSSTPLIGYLNGSDSAPNDNTLEFVNVVGAEGSNYGFSYDTKGGNAPYTHVNLTLGSATNGMFINNGQLQGPTQGGFFGEFFFHISDSLLVSMAI